MPHLLKQGWIKLCLENNFDSLSSLAHVMAGSFFSSSILHFYKLFQCKHMSGVYIRSLMTPTLDLVTGNNLKQEIASTRQSSLITNGTSNNRNASQAKSAHPILWAENHTL